MSLTISGAGSINGLTGPQGIPDVISDGIFIKNIANVSQDIELELTPNPPNTQSYNYGSFGPVSIDTGVTVTIGTDATWSIV